MEKELGAPVTESSSSLVSTTSPGQASTFRQDYANAQRFAEEHRKAVEEERLDKKKKENFISAIANHCLKPQRGGGVINSCSFPVEYSYCVEKPVKGTWAAEMFDCAKKQGGAWSVKAGGKGIMHVDGERVYFFACQSGSSDGKSHGIHPADVEYHPGSGLYGRCASW